MAKLTVAFGIILIVVGVFSFIITGHHAPTSLIPAFVGLLLAIFGALANTDDSKKRMLHMHIAVTIGLLGFLGTAKSIVDYIQMQMQVKQFARPVAVEEKAAMGVLLLIFVLLCVRSFINARRARA